MINGAHANHLQQNPEPTARSSATRWGLPHVDVGHGWLIFGLPPAEVAVHPERENASTSSI